MPKTTYGIKRRSIFFLHVWSVLLTQIAHPRNKEKQLHMEQINDSMDGITPIHMANIYRVNNE